MSETLTDAINLELSRAHMPEYDEIQAVLGGMAQEDLHASLLGENFGRYFKVVRLYPNGTVPEFDDIDEAARIGDAYAQALQWLVIKYDAELIDCEADKGSRRSISRDTAILAWEQDRQITRVTEKRESRVLELDEIDQSLQLMEGALAVARMKMEGSLEPFERFDGSLSTE